MNTSPSFLKQCSRCKLHCESRTVRNCHMAEPLGLRGVHSRYRRLCSATVQDTDPSGVASGEDYSIIPLRNAADNFSLITAGACIVKLKRKRLGYCELQQQTRSRNRAYSEMKRPPAKKGVAAKKGNQKQRDWRRMSLNLSVRFRNARSRVSMKETNTIGELKEEIAVLSAICR